jgi:hypothetical protein
MHTTVDFTEYTSNLQLYKFEIIGFGKFRPKFGRGKHCLTKIVFKRVCKLIDSHVASKSKVLEYSKFRVTSLWTESFSHRNSRAASSAPGARAELPCVCTCNYRDCSLGKDQRFPAKLSKSGPDKSKRIVLERARPIRALNYVLIMRTCRSLMCLNFLLKKMVRK